MDFSKYENKVPYPERPKRLTDADRQTILSFAGADAVALAEKADRENEERYSADIGAYSKEQSRVSRAFYVDICTENGVDPESKFASLLYYEAWEDGHSSGLSEVATVFVARLSFIKGIDKARAEDAAKAGK